MERHVAECEECRRVLAGLRRMLDALPRLAGTGGATDAVEIAAAVRGEGAFPVPAEQAVHTIAVLDAARVSAAENRVVDLSAQ